MTLSFVALGVVLAAASLAQPAKAPVPAASGAPASPAPTASAPPAAVSDPCESLSSLVSRPTFGTSACAVKRGDLLIETGYTNATTGGTGANSVVTYPQASLRVGLGSNLEFDLDPESVARFSGSPRATGTTDSALGFKYELGYTSKMLYGVNVLYTLPTGSAPFSGFGDGLLANVNAAYALSPALGLFATLGYNVQSAGVPGIPAHYHDFQPSLGASLALPQSFDFFLEGFNQSSTGIGLGGRSGFDTGFQKDVGSRLQLDVNYYDYLGAQNGAHQHSIGFGASYAIGS